MNDQIVKLILETLGTDGVKELRTALGDVNTEGNETAETLTKVGERARDALGRFTSSAQAIKESFGDTFHLVEDTYEIVAENEDEAAAATKRFTQQLEERKQAYLELVRAQEKIGSTPLRPVLDQTAEGLDKVEASAKKASSGVAGFGQAALQSGRVVQDFAQGGIPGILNNIEGLTQALGLGSGLAGAFTIAGVAAFVFKDQIIQMFHDLTGTAKPFLTDIQELEKTLKDLKDKPHTLVIDVLQIEEAQKKLDTLKRTLAEYEAQQRQQSMAQVESGKKIQEALRESALGAGGVEDLVAGRLRDENLAKAKEAGGRIAEALRKRAEAEEESAQAMRAIQTAPTEALTLAALTRRKEAERKIDASYNEETTAREQIASAAQIEYAETLRLAREAPGAAQIEAQKKLQALLSGAGMADLAGQIGQFTPEMIRRTKELASIGAGAEPAARAELARAQKQQAEERAFDEEATRVYNKAIEDRKKAADKEEDERQKRADKLSAAQDKESASQFEASLKGSGIAEQAGAMLAQLQAQGGVFDPRLGRVVGMSPADQEALVRRQVEQYLHRQIGVDRFGRKQFAGAGMGAEETGLTAQAIVARGQQQITGALAGMAGQQKSNTDKLLGVSSFLQSEVAKLQAQMAQQSQQVDGLVHKTKRSANTRLAR